MKKKTKEVTIASIRRNELNPNQLKNELIKSKKEINKLKKSLLVSESSNRLKYLIMEQKGFYYMESPFIPEDMGFVKTFTEDSELGPYHLFINTSNHNLQLYRYFKRDKWVVLYDDEEFPGAISVEIKNKFQADLFFEMIGVSISV